MKQILVNNCLTDCVRYEDCQFAETWDKIPSSKCPLPDVPEPFGWSKNTPTKPGWYVTRHDGTTIRVNEYHERELHELRNIPFEWLGPLPE